jgi:hypothetical protein
MCDVGVASFTISVRPRRSREDCLNLPWVAPTAIHVAVLQTAGRDLHHRMYSGLNARMKSGFLTRRVKTMDSRRWNLRFAKKWVTTPPGSYADLQTGCRSKVGNPGDGVVGQASCLSSSSSSSTMLFRAIQPYSGRRAACPSTGWPITQAVPSRPASGS